MSQKIVFMGTPEFSVPTLESLVNSNHKVLAVYSQPASKANRGQKIISSDVEIFAKEHFLNLRTPASLDNEFLEYEFTANDLDLFIGYTIKIVMSGTNQALPPRIKELRTIATR